MLFIRPTDLSIELFDRFRVAYRENGEVKTCSKTEFADLLKKGILGLDTLVFNNLIQTRADLETRWEVPVKDSWHARVFI